MRLLPVPDAWLAYSVHRKLLDEGLLSVLGKIQGLVLEVGNGREKRRGRFKPPFHQSTNWWFADIENMRNPHLLANFESLPFIEDSFDVVIALEVLEYVSAPLNACHEALRILRPEGVFIFSSPLFFQRDHIHDFWRITDRGLEHLLSQAGFMDISVRPLGGGHACLAHLLQSLLRAKSSSFLRSAMALILRPLVRRLLALDKLRPVDGWTTGYLVTAKKPKANS